jgi:hypoxanthine phosphoribosyltransferase
MSDGLAISSDAPVPGREVEVPLDYVGWTVGAEFLVEYGLDAAERYRNSPYVGVLEEA